MGGIGQVSRGCGEKKVDERKQRDSKVREYHNNPSITFSIRLSLVAVLARGTL